jgi:hypothetical protein
MDLYSDLLMETYLDSLKDFQKNSPKDSGMAIMMEITMAILTET